MGHSPKNWKGIRCVFKQFRLLHGHLPRTNLVGRLPIFVDCPFWMEGECCFSMQCSTPFLKFTAPMSREEAIPVVGIYLLARVFLFFRFVSVPPLCMMVVFLWNHWRLIPQYESFNEPCQF